MLFLARLVWKYRSEIVLGVQFLAALRKSAKEATEDYIRKRIREKLRSQLIIVGVEIGLLILALFLSPLWASIILWAITLYNLFELFFHTIPELRAVYRQLKGKVGFALKYFLEVSVATELMQMNVIFLVVCLLLGISTRTYVGSHFSYTKPWKAIARKH